MVNHNILCDKLNYYGIRGSVNRLLKTIPLINGFDLVTTIHIYRDIEGKDTILIQIFQNEINYLL